ncbi:MULTISPECIES: hypothetical protein [unclassified Sphingomonas]|uniref:hypothetical protein n=1 Tax=unclassified Sphingomonas TaxID=196159 RepID=UPI00226A1E72|nr:MULTISPECIES: hypothetical protein [unclassified Sphingomonas]
MPAAMHEVMDRMDAIILEAKAMIATGSATSLEPLRPLRLRMAGAITSFQFSLDEQMKVMASQHNSKLSTLRSAADAWNQIATEFRAFTSLAQSSNAPTWEEYTRQANHFMRRIADQIHSIKVILSG